MTNDIEAALFLISLAHTNTYEFTSHIYLEWRGIPLFFFVRLNVLFDTWIWVKVFVIFQEKKILVNIHSAVIFINTTTEKAGTKG